MSGFSKKTKRVSMPASCVYVGIDVACASGKRLPVCVVSTGHRLEPLRIPNHLADLIPRGVGNSEIAKDSPFHQAAHEVVSAIRRIEGEMGWRIERVAVDAPAAPPATGSRTAEDELAKCGLSSFRTPHEPAWDGIREKCASHLGSGRSLATLPYANKIWMLFGFQLIAELRNSFKAEVIEVYPFAIVRSLPTQAGHKSTENGYRLQLAEIAVRTGWEPLELEAELKASVSGARHDRLDAFMAAWLASLPSANRRAFGDALDPDDSIWVPL